MLMAMNARRLLPLLLMAAMITTVPASAQEQAAPPQQKAEAAESVAPAESAAAPDDDEEPVKPASVPHAAPEKLRLELHQVEDERAHSGNLLPWATVGLGAGTVLVSAIAGAVKTLSCDPGCATPNWVAFAVVAGALVGTLGAIWVIHTDNNLRELDYRRYQLQEALLQYELARVRRDPTLARGNTAFSLRVAF
jgi:hypothetical protein